LYSGNRFSTQHDARQRSPALIVLKEENNNNNNDCISGCAIVGFVWSLRTFLPIWGNGNSEWVFSPSACCIFRPVQQLAGPIAGSAVHGYSTLIMVCEDCTIILVLTASSYN